MMAARSGDEREDDGRPAVSVDKYVAYIFPTKKTGNNKRAGNERNKRGKVVRKRRNVKERKSLDERSILTHIIVYSQRC